MEILEGVIKLYCQALKDNDFQTITDLFSREAMVLSLFEGEKNPHDFFENLFKKSSRTKVEIENIFFDSHDKKIVAVLANIEAAWGNQEAACFEAVDIFEFDQDNKIKKLKIILDTFPIKEQIRG